MSLAVPVPELEGIIHPFASELHNRILPEVPGTPVPSCHVEILGLHSANDGFVCLAPGEEGNGWELPLAGVLPCIRKSARRNFDIAL
ncbi:hypothetical protein SBA3_4320001 [Candidatus Sulfopaludibacter sp. SbA3]|nr:hypothetical protein SBA3_4320001 [Candidatus Sulfopaludibacter sp. SbA3]